MEEDEKKITINKDRVFVAILAAMFLIAAVQALQLFGMSATLNDQQARLASLEASASQISQSDLSSGDTSGGNFISENLVNLPDMVGGC